jgi:hypothetical protein
MASKGVIGGDGVSVMARLLALVDASTARDSDSVWDENNVRPTALECLIRLGQYSMTRLRFAEGTQAGYLVYLKTVNAGSNPA